ncbi:hypothetical protein GIB67_040928 [Kingdonia uniflora]|uniref:Uncharacterized protein n=1 Tax=Kingdonia uniflora TaxID=39325 RepID=A0A7J7PCJ8_9MAGN|nr:hypothetical protein GIB67_040928 [Kingdonia uniflora]
MTKLIEEARNNASAYEKRSEYCERDTSKCDLSTTTHLDPLRTYPYRYSAVDLKDNHKADDVIMELSEAMAFKPDLQLLSLRAQLYNSMDDPNQNREQNKFQIKVQTEDSKNYHSYVLRDFEAAPLFQSQPFGNIWYV